MTHRISNAFPVEDRNLPIVNKMTADGLATQRARASAVMGLTYVYWNIPISSEEVLHFNFYQCVHNCCYATPR